MEYCSIVLTIFISFFLLFNHWHNNKGVLYLVFSIITFSAFQFTLLVLNTSRNPILLSFFIGNIDPFLAMVGPFVLYYFKSIVKGKLVYNRYLLLLLLPSFLSCINLIPYYSIPFNLKVTYYEHLGANSSPLPYLYLPVPFQLDIILVYNFALIVYGIFFLLKIKRNPNLTKRKKLINLINQVLILLTFIILGDLLLVFLLGITSDNFYQIKHTYAFINKNYLCFYINMILPIFFFLVPDLLFHNRLPFKGSLSENENISSREKLLTFIDPSSDELKNDDDLILEYLHIEKPYLKQDFCIHDISKHLNIPTVKVTNYFNRSLKISFPAYRNFLRLEYAISLIKSGEHLNTSIEGISHFSGFKSKTIFYEVFKKHYGITPAKWIKKYYVNDII